MAADYFGGPLIAYEGLLTTDIMINNSWTIPILPLAKGNVLLGIHFSIKVYFFSFFLV